MKELILTQKEITVLRNLNDNLDEKEILTDLEEYWLINGISSDTRWYATANLIKDWKQLLRQLDEHEWLLDNFKFTFNLWVVKISTK